VLLGLIEAFSYIQFETTYIQAVQNRLPKQFGIQKGFLE
jgi:hypothetical protein